MNITQIRYNILLFCKILSIIIYLYLLSKANNYVVHWDILTSIFPNVAKSINGMLSMIGVYILSIPLMIILVSLLIPESTLLMILSALFGVFSLATSFFLNMIRNVERYDMRMLVVSKLLTFKERCSIFLHEYTEILEKHFTKGIPAQYKDPTFYECYYDKLKETTYNSVAEINGYAKEVTAKLIAKTVEEPSFSYLEYMPSGNTMKKVSIVVAVIIVAYLGYAMLSNFELVGKSVEKSLEAQKITTGIATTAQKAIDKTKELAETAEISKKFAELGFDWTFGHLQVLHNKMADLETKINAFALTIEKLTKHGAI